MATALSSGCDFFSFWSTAPTDVSGTQYGGTNQNGSIGPPSSTFMSFVGQYVDVITSAQLSALNDAGLFVYFYMENGSIQSNAYFAGLTNAQAKAQGVTDAQTVQSSLAGLGIPSNWPVYFAIDFDANSSAFPNIGYYFLGIVETIGSSANVGVYGSGFCCEQINLFLFGNSSPALGYFIQSRSTGYDGNGSYLGATTGTTQNLWQWPPGYSPGGDVVINGHETDGVFAYTSNFGQYPSSPGEGVLTNATVINPTITYTQSQPQTIIVPKYTYDHVIYSTIYTTSVTSASWPQNVLGPATNINQYAYPFGNYTATVNGGSPETNDFGFISASNYGSFVGNLPDVVVQPIVDSGGNLSFDVTLTSGGSATIDLTIDIALMASYNPASTGTSVSQLTAYSSLLPGGEPTAYSTYRRIALDSYVGTGVSTVPHNLGEVPNILYWVQDNSDDIEMQPVAWTSHGQADGFGISMDSTNVYFYVDSANNNTAYYRVYLDN